MRLYSRYCRLNFQSWQTKWNLLRALVGRDLAAKYQGSILGNLWPLLNQLAQLLIYTYVFSIVLQVKLSLQGLNGDSNFTFGLWLFAGLLPWLAFTNGLITATNSVIAQPNLVKKVVFPLELLPIVPILSALFESALGLAVLIVAVAIVTHNLYPTLALLPLIWLPQLLFTAGLGYLTAGLTVFVRDVPQTLTVILNLWFYLTPIVYPVDVIPEFLQQWVFWLNPPSAIAQIYRDLVIVGEVNHGWQWLWLTGVSFVFAWLGFSVYRRLRNGFADVL